MSNTRAAAKLVYQPITLAKKLAAADIPTLVLRLLPHDGETRVTPRDVPMTIAAAQAAISGRTSAESYLGGAMRLLAAHAYGQDALGALVKPLDPANRAAITHAAGHLAVGAGIDANRLRMAAALAAQHILDLPVKPERIKDAGDDAAAPSQITPDEEEGSNINAALTIAIPAIRRAGLGLALSEIESAGAALIEAWSAAFAASLLAAPVAAKAKAKAKAKKEPAAPVAAKSKKEPAAPVAAKAKAKSKPAPASMAAQLLAA